MLDSMRGCSSSFFSLSSSSSFSSSSFSSSSFSLPARDRRGHHRISTASITAGSGSQWASSDLNHQLSYWAPPDANCQLKSSVGTAGPQPATSGSQWGLPDLNWRRPDRSGHRRTSTASENARNYSRWNARIYVRKVARIYVG